MKKLAIVLALAMVISVAAAIGTSAYYNGTKPQYEYVVPKINPANPKIAIDAVADLEGEWYGALKVTIDLTEYTEEITIWSPDVWSGTMAVNTYDELPEDLKATWDSYFLWDEAGLYYLLVCDNDVTYAGPADGEAYAKYWNGETEAYEGTVDDRIGHMFTPSDDFEGLNNAAGNMYWYYAYTSTLNIPFWGEGQTTDFATNNPNNKFELDIAIQRDATPNAEGAYPYVMEIFFPWDAFRYDTDGATIKWDFVAAEGWTFMMGMIYRNTGLDNTYYVQASNAAGWWNYDYYTLGAMAEASPVQQTVEEDDEEELVEIEDDEEETTEVEEDDEEETTTTTSNPVTSDVSVIFYALAAISAVGGLSIFRKK